MFRNYFLITFRALRKSKLYSGINVLGLGIAMAVVLLIAVYVSFDLSVDQSHPGKEKIYRTTVDIVDSEWAWAQSFPGLGPWLKSNYAEVEDVTRVYPAREPGVVVQPDQHSENKHIEAKSYYADPNIFEFFDLPLLAGDPTQLLQEPQQVVISAELADKYFGYDDFGDLVGQVLAITDETHEEKLYSMSLDQLKPIDVSCYRTVTPGIK